MTADVINVPFTYGELHDINNALARYESYLEDCCICFKGTGHEVTFTTNKERVTKLRSKLHGILSIAGGTDDV